MSEVEDPDKFFSTLIYNNETSLDGAHCDQHGPLILIAYANWCPHCQECVPTLIKVVHEMLAEGYKFRVAGVDCGNTTNALLGVLITFIIIIGVLFSSECEGVPGIFRVLRRGNFDE